jgi:pimeloyl-ACP methyl ester carboxylesterase
LSQINPLQMLIRQGSTYANSTLTATATPPGGTFTWTFALNGIVDIDGTGNQVQIVGLTTGATDVVVLYTAPDGRTATASVLVRVFYPTILVHGIASSAEIWATLRTTLESKGLLYDDCFAVASTDVDFCAIDFTGAGLPEGNQTDFMTEGQILGTYITNLLRYTGAAKINLVAHSMGGLVSRAAIQRYGHAGDVDLLLTVGTPNLGSPLANLLSDPLNEYSALGAVVEAFPQHLNANSSGVQSLRTDSPLLLNLNSTASVELPATTHYVSVIGTESPTISAAAVVGYDSLVGLFCELGPNSADCANVSSNQTVIDDFLPSSDLLVSSDSQNLHSVDPFVQVSTAQLQCGHTSEPGLVVDLALEYMGLQ